MKEEDRRLKKEETGNKKEETRNKKQGRRNKKQETRRKKEEEKSRRPAIWTDFTRDPRFTRPHLSRDAARSAFTQVGLKF